jgi:hypothetical protein
MFGAVLFLLSRQDLLDRQARKASGDAAGSLTEEEERLDREVAVLCLLRRFLSRIQHLCGSRTLRGLALLPLALINFVSSATSALLFKSLWSPTRDNFTSDAAGRTQAAGILCLCTTGVLSVNFYPFLSTWWLFFSGVVGAEWMPVLPIGVWVYALLSYAHGYRLLSRHGEPRPDSVESEAGRLGRVYLLLLVSAMIAVAVAFALLPSKLSNPTNSATADAVSTQAGAVISAIGEPKPCDPKQIRANQAEEKKVAAEQANAARLWVCTLLLGLAVSLLMAQGWLYRFHLLAANERWGPSGFWNVLLDGMRGVFVTLVMLVVILAFKDVMLEALPNTAPCAPEPSGLMQTLWALGAIVVTLVAGMALGSAWGAFTLGFLTLQIGAVSPLPELVQVLILIATFCNQRSPRADNVLNLLGTQHMSSAVVRSVWSATSFTLKIAGRRFALRAEFVQWLLVGMGIAASGVQAALR